VGSVLHCDCASVDRLIFVLTDLMFVTSLAVLHSTLPVFFFLSFWKPLWYIGAKCTTMGCIQSTPADRPQRKKKQVGKKGKKAPGSAAKESGKSTPAVTPSKKPSIGSHGAKPSAGNPLNFTKEEDKAAGQERRNSNATSSSASLRDLLANQSNADSKHALIEHTPLSDGKRKNLCVWIDSIDKVSLLDPEDYTGQQRRDREAAGRQQQNPNLRNGKRMSILLAFTTVEHPSSTEDQQRQDGSVAVGHEDERSASSDLISSKI
jgi:hypothetical protein